MHTTATKIVFKDLKQEMYLITKENSLPTFQNKSASPYVCPVSWMTLEQMIGGYAKNRQRGYFFRKLSGRSVKTSVHIKFRH